MGARPVNDPQRIIRLLGMGRAQSFSLHAQDGAMLGIVDCWEFLNLGILVAAWERMGADFEIRCALVAETKGGPFGTAYGQLISEMADFFRGGLQDRINDGDTAAAITARGWAYPPKAG